MTVSTLIETKRALGPESFGLASTEKDISGMMNSVL